MIHFIMVPFTGFGAHGGYRGDRWLENRIIVFKRFVLPSLMRQTKREFILWICWRPEEFINLQVKALAKYLDMLQGLTYVQTFSGIPMYDDKYPDEMAKERLLTALQGALPHLRPLVGDDKKVLLTVQPSDDIYHVDAIRVLQQTAKKLKGKGQAIGWRKGYIINCATKEVAQYDPDTIPPFTTFIFKAETFLNPWEHLDFIGPYESHEHVNKYLSYKELPGRMFMVGTHGENISTTWSIPYKKQVVKDPETVWLAFGCWDADPIIMHKNPHLIARRLFNALPRPLNELIRRVYKKVSK